MYSLLLCGNLSLIGGNFNDYGSLVITVYNYYTERSKEEQGMCLQYGRFLSMLSFFLIATLGAKTH